MTETVITARDVSFNFGDVNAIQRLDLIIHKSTIYGFLGPNGSGKTTAIRLLTGLLTPHSGNINVLGFQLPGEAESLKRHIGYMTQKFSLFDDLTVEENLKFMANILSVPARQQKNRILELLSCFGLTSNRRQLAGKMSGGQRQRLALAAAIIHAPEILFLDEPTSAVDPENRRAFWEKLFDLCDQGTTILVSTHYMDEAERCHRLAILEEGVKRADGVPSELMQNIEAHVVEVFAQEPKVLKKHLHALPSVISVAQIGSRLRVLVHKNNADPLQYLSAQAWVATSDILTLVRPNLEDVFVTCTGGRSG